MGVPGLAMAPLLGGWVGGGWLGRVQRMNRPLHPHRSALLDERRPEAVSPPIAGLEVADSSFGAWLDAGGERRQAPRAERDPWTPEQRAMKLTARSQPGWDRLQPAAIKR